VSWGEDASLIRDKVAAQNMASLCKITLNLPRLDQSRQPKKVSPREHPQSRRMGYRSA